MSNAVAVESLSLAPLEAKDEVVGGNLDDPSTEPMLDSKNAQEQPVVKQPANPAAGKKSQPPRKKRSRGGAIDYEGLVAQAILSNMGQRQTGQLICHWISMHYPALSVCAAAACPAHVKRNTLSSVTEVCLPM